MAARNPLLNARALVTIAVVSAITTAALSHLSSRKAA